MPQPEATALDIIDARGLQHVLGRVVLRDLAPGLARTLRGREDHRAGNALLHAHFEPVAQKLARPGSHRRLTGGGVPIAWDTQLPRRSLRGAAIGDDARGFECPNLARREPG